MKKQTGAATGCGGCQELVRACCQLSSYQQTESQDIFCPCTDVEEETIFSYIKKQQPLNAEQIRRQFQWITNNGCGKCRPAIQYYLEQFQDRFVKNGPAEQEHILMPQLYGGRLDLKFLQIITALLEKSRFSRQN